MRILLRSVVLAFVVAGCPVSPASPAPSRRGALVERERGLEGVTLTLRPVGPRRFVATHWLADPGEIDLRFHVGDPDEEVVLVVRLQHELHLPLD